MPGQLIDWSFCPTMSWCRVTPLLRKIKWPNNNNNKKTWTIKPVVTYFSWCVLDLHSCTKYLIFFFRVDECLKSISGEKHVKSTSHALREAKKWVGNNGHFTLLMETMLATQEELKPLNFGNTSRENWGTIRQWCDLFFFFFGIEHHWDCSQWLSNVCIACNDELASLLPSYHCTFYSLALLWYDSHIDVLAS